MSFFDSANAGLLKARDDFGLEYRVVECSNDVTKFEPSLIDLAEEGFDMIFIGSDFKDYVEKYADEYPNTVFVMFDEEVDWSKGQLKNVNCVVYKANEAAFLGGFLAAKLTVSGQEGYNEEKVISFLGGIDIPVINDFLVGYISGAQKAVPDIKVAISYVGDWSDSAKGKELALSMYSLGADIGFNVAGGAGLGLIEAAVEQKKYVLGVDSDQAMMFKESNPQFSAVIPSSVLKNVGDSLYRAVDLHLKGTLNLGGTDELGIADGAVGLADNEFYQSMVPEDIRNEVAELEQQILEGKISVDTAYGKTTQQIDEIRNAVKP